jgi:hypothetical protein
VIISLPLGDKSITVKMASLGSRRLRVFHSWPGPMIRVDAIGLATEPMDMRAGTETALARVVAVFGAAKSHCAYLFANRRAIGDRPAPIDCMLPGGNIDASYILPIWHRHSGLKLQRYKCRQSASPPIKIDRYPLANQIAVDAVSQGHAGNGQIRAQAFLDTWALKGLG